MSKLSNPSKKLKNGTQPLTSLGKGLKLLLSLRDSSGPISLTELSRDLRLNKVSALRILLTLEQHRFVEKNVHDKKYQIGSNAFYVGSGFILGEKRNKILQVMGRLVHDLKHTITLGVLDGASVLFQGRNIHWSNPTIMAKQVFDMRNCSNRSSANPANRIVSEEIFASTATYYRQE